MAQKSTFVFGGVWWHFLSGLLLGVCPVREVCSQGVCSQRGFGSTPCEQTVADLRMGVGARTHAPATGWHQSIATLMFHHLVSCKRMFPVTEHFNIYFHDFAFLVSGLSSPITPTVVEQIYLCHVYLQLNRLHASCVPLFPFAFQCLSRNCLFERINSLQCYKLTRRCSHLLFT